MPSLCTPAHSSRTPRTAKSSSTRLERTYQPSARPHPPRVSTRQPLLAPRPQPPRDPARAYACGVVYLPDAGISDQGEVLGGSQASDAGAAPGILSWLFPNWPTRNAQTSPDKQRKRPRSGSSVVEAFSSGERICSIPAHSWRRDMPDNATSARVCIRRPVHRDVRRQRRTWDCSVDALHASPLILRLDLHRATSRVRTPGRASPPWGTSLIWPPLYSLSPLS
ncbi:hypothetical protein CERSUDRAFT_98700 [Gelatoporia subvermispora B]|uniref:Uncharacterized protein n=1 Tax=Ceriporiopsis subvermispora (strain B) TaxID=914234 RepID=M2R4F6_CERS8|nr:hypothetical protein CERSUDRAFT_98700 [Gelatoporia subvermispora B]